MADPLIIVEFACAEEAQTPDYSGPVVTLVVRVPVAQVPNLNNNDANRRVVAKAIADTIPPENP